MMKIEQLLCTTRKVCHDLIVPGQATVSTPLAPDERCTSGAEDRRYEVFGIGGRERFAEYQPPVRDGAGERAARKPCVDVRGGRRDGVDERTEAPHTVGAVDPSQFRVGLGCASQCDGQ
jgi:hypothetical protein